MPILTVFARDHTDLEWLMRLTACADLQSDRERSSITFY
jgi:hypothetical protein